MSEEETNKIRAMLIAVILGTTAVNQAIDRLMPSAEAQFNGTDAWALKQQLQQEIMELREDYIRTRRLNEERLQLLEQRISTLKDQMGLQHDSR